MTVICKHALVGEGIEPGIKVREDSSPECGGLERRFREEVVRAYLRDPPGWKKQVGYGQRWIVETFFPGFKRLFGGVVHTKRFKQMIKEIELKVWVYNPMLGLATAPALSTAGVDRRGGRMYMLC